MNKSAILGGKRGALRRNKESRLYHNKREQGTIGESIWPFMTLTLLLGLALNS